MAAERTVLIYGDSNSHGTQPMAHLLDARRHPRATRWPGVMANALGPGWQVVEEALPGRTTVHADPVSGVHKNGLAVLPAVLESHAPLDLVVLLLGTNDCKARFNAPPVEIAVSVEQLVRHIRQGFTGPGGTAPACLLIAPAPVKEAGCLAEIFAGGAAKSTRLAPLYAEVAARWGAGFLDAGALVASSDLDGVHLDAAAHGALGAAVAEKVREIMG
jgi:lysophospholipase L1-like esterase